MNPQVGHRHAWTGALLTLALTVACDLPSLPEGTDEQPQSAPARQSTEYSLPKMPLRIDAWPDSKIEASDGSATVMPPDFAGVGDALAIDPYPDASLEEAFKTYTAHYPPQGEQGHIELGDERIEVRTLEHRLTADRFIITDDMKLDGAWHPGNRRVGIVVGGRVYTCSAGHSPRDFAEVGLEFCKTLRSAS